MLFDVTNSSNPVITQQLGISASYIGAIQPLDDCGAFSAASQGSFIITTEYEAAHGVYSDGDVNSVRRCAQDIRHCGSVSLVWQLRAHRMHAVPCVTFKSSLCLANGIMGFLQHADLVLMVPVQG